MSDILKNLQSQHGLRDLNISFNPIYSEIKKYEKNDRKNKKNK